MSNQDPADEPAKNRLDPGAVAALYVRYSGEILRFLEGVLRDRELAGEALQATFARLVEIGHTARSDTVKGWLFRVAFTEAMQFRRRQRVRSRIHQEMSLDGSRERSADRPEERLSRFETVERIRAAIAELAPEQQQVVRRRMYEGHTFARIAADLGLPLGTVLTRMRIALQSLRRRLRGTDAAE